MNSRGGDTANTSAGAAREQSAQIVGRSGLAGRALQFDFARKRVRVTDVFESGAGQIPNNPLIAAGLAAIFKGGPKARSLIGGWLEDAGGNPIYRHLGNKGGMIVVYVDPVTTAAGSMPTADDVWEFGPPLKIAVKQASTIGEVRLP